MILDWLKEANVPLSLFCEKLEISTEYALNVASTADSDTQFDLYYQFVTTLNDEELFPKLIDFFCPYFTNKKVLASFISSILKLRNNNIPRRMLNSIERLVTLADDTETIRPGKHCLKIFYFVVCIETLYKLAEIKMNSKTLTVIDFFTKYIAEDDQQLILDLFHRNLADDKFHVYRLPSETDEQYEERMNTSVDRTFNTRVTMEVFARVINELRNGFAHEGDYWHFHFSEGDHSVMNSLVVAESHKEVQQKSKGKRIYSVDLTYDQFKAACVRGYVHLVNSYFTDLQVKTLAARSIAGDQTS